MAERESTPRRGAAHPEALEGSSGGRPTNANPSRSSSPTNHERNRLTP